MMAAMSFVELSMSLVSFPEMVTSIGLELPGVRPLPKVHVMIERKADGYRYAGCVADVIGVGTV